MRTVLKRCKMVLETALGLFLTGLALGSTRCLLSCAPALLLYISGTKNNWKEGLSATLIFSFSRLLSYIILGFLAGSLGGAISSILNKEKVSNYLFLALGIFVIMIGILITIGKESTNKSCNYLQQITLKKSLISMVFLGFTIGFASYCLPFIALLSYISLSVRNPFLGAFYGFSFGLGASVITPLLALGIIFSLFPPLIFTQTKYLETFKRVCGIFLVIWGLRLLIEAVKIIFKLHF